MIAAESRTGYTSVDDFPPLTDTQCAHIATLLSLPIHASEGSPS